MESFSYENMSALLLCTFVCSSSAYTPLISQSFPSLWRRVLRRFRRPSEPAAPRSDSRRLGSRFSRVERRNKDIFEPRVSLFLVNVFLKYYVFF